MLLSRESSAALFQQQIQLVKGVGVKPPPGSMHVPSQHALSESCRGSSQVEIKYLARLALRYALHSVGGQAVLKEIFGFATSESKFH